MDNDKDPTPNTEEEDDEGSSVLLRDTLKKQARCQRDLHC